MMKSLALGARTITVVCLLLTAASFLRAHVAVGAATWQLTPLLLAPHGRSASALLHDGRVLVAGGVGVNGTVTNAAEIYDPSTNTWTPLPGMAMPRMDFTATTLPDGRVLVAGGNTGAFVTASTEIFDPRLNAWSAAAPLSVARSDQTATLLPDGTVLVIGGFGATGPTGSVERYNPVTNSWTAGESLQIPRADHTATLLTSGLVLVTGGFGQAGALSSVALYDPVTNRWQGFVPPPSLLRPRYDHTATLLPDGRVLVAGGFSPSGSEATAELYNPYDGSWSPAPSMTTPRAEQTATLLADGTVLVAGGAVLSGGQTTVTSSVEIYDPVGNRWVSVSAMNVPRYAQVAQRLLDGRVLVAGGLDAPASTSAELFTPPVLPTLSITPTSTPIPMSTPMPTVPVIPTPISRPPPVPTATSVPTATPPPTPASEPTFTLRAARVEPVGAPEDQSLSATPLRSVKVGTSVQLSLYARYSLTSATGVTLSLQVVHAGKTAFTAGSTDTLSGSGNVWDHWTFKPLSPGTFNVVGSMTVAGETQQVRTSFTAIKTSPTFTFDRLLTVNAAGKPATTFSRTQQVVVMAVVTVSHATGSVRMAIGQQLERPVAGGWQALGKRVQSSFVTTNGTHRYTISFYPQSPYPALRMVIDIALGKQTRTRAVVFSVHK